MKIFAPLANAAKHETWTELLEARGYQWAPLQEGHAGYAGPVEDMECEVIEVADDKTLVLTFGGSADNCHLLGYNGTSDIPSIFSATPAGVEVALRWVGAL